MSIQTSILNRRPCNFAGTIEWYYGHCPINSVMFERVLQKLLMRLVWNLFEYFNIYIHLDVNSDVNSQPFFINFAGTIGWNYGNCPINLAKFDWVHQKLLMQSTEPTLWQRRLSVFRWYLSQFLAVLHVILHTPFAAIAANALQIWWGLVEYSKSY